MATPSSKLLVVSVELFVLLALLISSVVDAQSSSCSSYTFSNNKVFSSCTDLPHLGASLHYDRDPSTNKLSVAFRAPQSAAGWVAWGLNPNGTGMVGSQAIVALRHSNGSMLAYPTRLESYAPSMAPATLAFPVTDVSAEYAGKEMIIFATLGLPGGGTQFNQVWQEGSTVLNGVPKAHSAAGDNIKSLGAIDFH